MGDAGEGNSKWGDDFGQVVRRGLSFHIGAECEDYLGRAVFFDSAEKRFDAELVGTDVVEWREASAQGVVKASKNSAAFERENIGRLLHDAEFLVLPSGLGADATQFLLGEKTALAARMDRRGGAGDGLRELGRPGVFVTKEPKRTPLGAPGPKAGQASKLTGELVKWSRVIERHRRS
jgi:hypothetical protein